ncbi:MAG: adenosylcobinamide-phosphate synthase CbiB [Syntrophobacteria bacterium]
MILASAILLLAFILDLLLGDPPYRFHPIRLMGMWARGSETLLLGLGLSGRTGGTMLVVGTIVAAVAGYLGLRSVLAGIHGWFAIIVDLYITYSCLALTDLLRHAMPVADALARDDLIEARSDLQRIVGRNTAWLDSAGVARAAVESLAENFVDGVLSPLLWYGAGAVLARLLQFPGATAAGVSMVICFKATSTLDSMVGYRHGHYLLFGRPAARLDDLANLIPARLSLAFLWGGALLSGENARAGLHTAKRDRLKHPSPNAGHPESFAAGVLGIKLGGPSPYPGGWVEKPWLGGGDAEPTADHIRRCARMISRSAWLCCILVVAAGLCMSAVLS